MPRAKKFFTREDIERAMRNTSSNRAAARFLRCSYFHYRQYAKMYKDEKTGKTLFEMHYNQGGKGIPKFALHPGYKHKKEPLVLDIIEGRVPLEHFNPQKLKYRLLEMNLLQQKCYRCGFTGHRLTDGKSPLILMHKDGNKQNWRLNNLEFLCYNCAYLEGHVECPVTDKFVENQEDYVDHNNAKEEKVWELDDYQREYLISLGLEKKEEEKPYEKYIAKL